MNSPILWIAGAIAASILAIGVILAKLYTRTSAQRVFVRTGLGGSKVVSAGGAVVLPIFHEIQWINMNTLKLEVTRGAKESLLTKDRLRVDISAEFYVRVKKDVPSIEMAAQTLGSRTLEPEMLKELVEGKFLDALRAGTMQMDMESIFDKRPEFVQFVKQAVSESLRENGLELEDVSLTRLNQTGIEHFDQNNALDAAGLLILTERVETKKRDRNAIVQDRNVEIDQKNLQANNSKLQIQLEGRQAVLTQEQKVQELEAQQKTAIEETVNKNRVAQESAVITANRTIEEAKIQNGRDVESARIEAETTVKMKSADQNIELANKSKDEAKANAEANEVKAVEVKSEEKVLTARAVEVASRQKEVTVVQAEEQALKDAIPIKVDAEARREAAVFLSEAAVTEASGQKEATIHRAEGVSKLGDAEAAALRALNEAKNALSPELIGQSIKLALISALPSIIREAVEPMKNIDSIKIANVGGLTGFGGHGNGQSVILGADGKPLASSGSTMANDITSAGLNFRAQAPVVDGLLQMVGLAGMGNLDNLVASAAAPLIGNSVKVEDSPSPSPSPAESAEEPVL